MNLRIFNGEEFLGNVDTKTDIKEGALMEIMSIHANDNADVYVLHVLNMGYGIIIPKDVALKINEAIDKEENGNKLEPSSELKIGDYITLVLYNGASLVNAEAVYGYLSRNYYDQIPIPIQNTRFI
jgi:hypothetical protein